MSLTVLLCLRSLFVVTGGILCKDETLCLCKQNNKLCLPEHLRFLCKDETIPMRTNTNTLLEPIMETTIEEDGLERKTVRKDYLDETEIPMMTNSSSSSPAEMMTDGFEDTVINVHNQTEEDGFERLTLQTEYVVKDENPRTVTSSPLAIEMTTDDFKKLPTGDVHNATEEDGFERLTILNHSYVGKDEIPTKTPITSNLTTQMKTEEDGSGERLLNETDYIKAYGSVWEDAENAVLETARLSKQHVPFDIPKRMESKDGETENGNEELEESLMEEEKVNSTTTAENVEMITEERFEIGTGLRDREVGKHEASESDGNGTTWSVDRESAPKTSHQGSNPGRHPHAVPIPWSNVQQTHEIADSKNEEGSFGNEAWNYASGRDVRNVRWIVLACILVQLLL